ncbi:MAG: HAD family phosphatase [Clostridia bacterium]|nr:HAD family phosphatase [Clostridia bacterium]
MNKFEGVLIASDFDGTLTDSKGNIPEINKEAIKYFIANGGKFTVSTGRTKIGFHNYDSEFINAPVLLGNGAMAYDYKENFAVFTNSINECDIDILNKIYNDNPWLSMELYSVDDKAYVLNPNPASIRHFNGLKVENYNIINELSEKMFPMVKIMLSVGERTFEIQNYLNKISLGNMKYIPCSGSFVEILSVNAGKGRALYQLAQYFNLEERNVFAVGDASNDVDMLKAASIGFVPVSADEYAKNAAKIQVCSSDDGAVAGVIRYLDEIY